MASEAVKDLKISIKLANPGIGWVKAFMEMHGNGDDKIIMQNILEEENLEE